MRLALRCDASFAGGVGHVIRSLSLAEAGRAAGHEVAVVGNIEVPWVRQLVADEDLPLLTPPPWQDLGVWASAEGFDAVHVDDYDAPAGLRDPFSSAGVVLSNVEDGTWGRRAADIVVDPSLGATTHRPDDGSSRVLAGERFTLLRAAVRRGRIAVASRPPRSAGPLNVVVVMGGTDAAGLLPRVLDIVADARREGGLPPLSVVAVTPSGVLPVAPLDLEVVPLPAGPNLLAALIEADVVVTAAGTTVGEVCCLGLPMALVPVVENQLPGYREVLRRGCAVGLADGRGPGLAADAAVALAALLRSSELRASLAQRAAALVDGAGAARVLRAIELAARAAPERLPSLTARPATPADSLLLLDWRNDEVVRAASRNHDVVSEDDHRAWFTSVLGSGRRHLLLVEDAAAQPLGSVRWDELPEAECAWEVSIMLAPHNRGRGWGASVLAAGERALEEIEPSARTLVASIHVDNRTSMRMFLDAGYRGSEGPDGHGFRRLQKPLR